MNLIKKLGCASLLAGAMFLTNPAKSALVNSDPYDVKEVRIEVYDPEKKESYPVTIKDFDKDGIIDEVIIYNMNGNDKWISLRNKFNSRKSKQNTNNFLRSFNTYVCSQKDCREMIILPQDVNMYQKKFKRKNILFGD